MAAAVGVSPSTVRRVWRAHGLKPHRMKTFKVSNDPAFAEKLEDIVGLYLNPPEHAVVLAFDEKSQIQALDRTQPGLPLKPGRRQTMTHDYKRNGTATLFAALNALAVSGCMDRHRITSGCVPEIARRPDAGGKTACMSSRITTPPTSIPKCSAGCSDIPACTCTSRQPVLPG